MKYLFFLFFLSLMLFSIAYNQQTAGEPKEEEKQTTDQTKEETEKKAEKKAEEKSEKKTPKLSKAERLNLGAEQYAANCAMCHLDKGQGYENTFPPLANSDFLKNRTDKGINIILKGIEGKIVVNGKEYDNPMPAMQLSDEEIANIMTYIYNQLNAIDLIVTPEEVAAERLKK